MRRTLVFCFVLLLSTLIFNHTGIADESAQYINVNKVEGFKLEIGAVLPQELLEKWGSKELILIGPSQQYPLCRILFKEIKYDLGIDNSKQIIYISTTDESFVTPESICVGMGFMEALQMTRASMMIEKGWASYLVLKSDWNAAFILKPDNTFNIKDSVAFIFKRKKQ